MSTFHANPADNLTHCPGTTSLIVVFFGAATAAAPRGGVVDASLVSSVHTWVEMPGLVVEKPTSVAGSAPLGPNGTATLCKASMGYAFAAGTTDGPGMFDFTQGTNSTNPLWNIVVNLIHKPSQELVNCQHVSELVSSRLHPRLVPPPTPRARALSLSLSLSLSLFPDMPL